MKKLVYLSAFLVCLTTVLFAQDAPTQIQEAPIVIDENWPDGSNTFIKEKSTHGVYLAIAGSYGQLGNRDLIQMESRLGYIADSKIDFSIVGQAFVTEKNVFNRAETNEFLAGGIGGLQVEPILFGKKMINVSFPLFIGGGVAALTTDEADDFLNCGPYDSNHLEPIFVAQPGISGILNITKFMQFELSAKYRLSSDMVFEDTNYGNLNGVNIGAGIKLGYFAFGKRSRRK